MNHSVHRLPILVISAHSRCNCRCGMCDIWRTTEPRQFTAADLSRQLSDIGRLGVEWVVFTGGEALMNPELFEMARVLRAAGIRVTVLTSGLLVERYVREIAEQIDNVIVSLDGPRHLHDRIRGVPGAFDHLASGVNALRALSPSYPIAARCTVQKANHSRLLDTAHAARSLQLDSISFLAVDVGSEAFHHLPVTLNSRIESLLPRGNEIDALEAELTRLAADPAMSIVAESPEKLRRIPRYFRAIAAGTAPQAPRCNAPWVSAVVDSSGAVRPCFFHPPIGDLTLHSLGSVINSEQALTFRRELDIPSNPICRRCVCSLNRPGKPGFEEVPA